MTSRLRKKSASFVHFNEKSHWLDGILIWSQFSVRFIHLNLYIRRIFKMDNKRKEKYIEKLINLTLFHHDNLLKQKNDDYCQSAIRLMKLFWIFCCFCSSNNVESIVYLSKDFAEWLNKLTFGWKNIEVFFSCHLFVWFCFSFFQFDLRAIYF